MLAALLLTAGAEVILTLEPPTERVNGTPLEPHELAYYKVYLDGNWISTMHEESVDLLLKGCPIYLTATAVDTNGLESAPSNRLMLCIRGNNLK